MSSDFKAVLIKDSRLCPTSAISYGVVKGGQSVVQNVFKSNTASTSSCVFNIQVPSENTFVDRRVLFRVEETFEMTVTNNTGAPITNANANATLGFGQSSVPAGVNTALSAWPVHQTFTTMSTTINNTTTSVNILDVLPALQLFSDTRDAFRYNSTTPNYIDNYGDYTQANGAINNPLGTYANSVDGSIVPRGAWPVTITNNLAGGAWASGTDCVFTIKFKAAEPLMLSPWIWNAFAEEPAIYGIQNLNFNFTCAPVNDRVIRTSLPCVPGATVYVKSTVLKSIDSAELIFNFLTGQISDIVPDRNVVSYYELPRFITPVGAAVLAGAQQTLVSQTLSLNQVPDKMILMVRKQMATQKPNDPDCYLPINNVSIQFNNNVGILSSATQQDLYRMSIEAGSSQNWYEFSGSALSGASGLASNAVRTTGSVLMLDFGTAINLSENFYAPGSIGNFNIQVTLNVTNNTGANIVGNTYEIVQIFMNSGCFVTERGSSQQYTGILTKQVVIDASEGEVYTRGDVRRLVGGGFFDTLKNIASNVIGAVRTVAPIAKTVLSAIPDPRAQAVAQGMNAVGLGTTGGARKKVDVRLM